MTDSEKLAEKPAAEAPPEANNAADWRFRWHEIIFEADTPKGKAFDVGLLIAIVISVIIVMLQSVSAIEERFGAILNITEWTITIGFSIEYALRIACVRQPFRYIFSFWGIVDLLSVLPTYMGLIIPGSQSFSVVRVLRLIRVFRIFKLNNYIQESRVLLEALKAARPKIIVFLLVVMSLILVMGTTVYVIENLFSEKTQFTSIPKSIYWAIVTITTVGYGDIAPQTIPGQTIAAIAMILGYAIIIVPSGIFSVEIIAASKAQTNTQVCLTCTKEGHDDDAMYCKYCGSKL
ncbi:MAG: ion transporter [Planctomycetaceae bacterium]|nr:ion transporter [Planctomycetaceae bacterium]|tara:strand:- start:946 stop:1818 length:873 start_codon:yes stop_codon:yes gene_type:complete